ncbi:hypothetical protein HY990_03280 [Candidatus Micrarchaeota archaeon]|nr:hypothetical protein [Candidatus Micrarchaeota archaeon]
MASYNVDQILTDLRGAGLTNDDAMVIADVIVTRGSCSWVNTDPVDESIILKLRDVIAQRNYKIRINVDSIPTRSKYVWEAKALP